MSTEQTVADSTQQTAHGSGAEQKAESGEKTTDGSGYSGGRVEPVDTSVVPTMDDQSAYDAALPPVPEGLMSTAGVVEFTLTNHAPATVELSGDSLEAEHERHLELQADGVEVAEEAAAPTMRLLGADVEGLGQEVGDGLDWVSPDEEVDFGDVMIQLVDSALEEGEGFDGQQLAQIFCRGDVEDERVAFLLLLLGQNRPVTGELVLQVASERGYEELVLQARLAREELQAAGDVAVEQATVYGGYVPISESLGSQPLSGQPFSGLSSSGSLSSGSPSAGQPSAGLEASP